MVRRMRAFAVVSEMDRGGVSVAMAAALATSSAAWYARMTWSPYEDGGAFSVIQPLTNKPGFTCSTLYSYK